MTTFVPFGQAARTVTEPKPPAPPVTMAGAATARWHPVAQLGRVRISTRSSLE